MDWLKLVVGGGTSAKILSMNAVQGYYERGSVGALRRLYGR